jgi:hypothetical protein
VGDHPRHGHPVSSWTKLDTSYSAGLGEGDEVVANITSRIAGGKLCGLVYTEISGSETYGHALITTAPGMRSYYLSVSCHPFCSSDS